MSETSTEDSLSQQLDRVLREQNEADAEAREFEREYRTKRDRVSRLEDEARRLRMALWALQGKPLDQGSAGRANSANHERRSELRSEDR